MRVTEEFFRKGLGERGEVGHGERKAGQYMYSTVDSTPYL